MLKCRQSRIDKGLRPLINPGILRQNERNGKNRSFKIIVFVRLFFSLCFFLFSFRPKRKEKENGLFYTYLSGLFLGIMGDSQ